jgi:LppP/LprE lipoprotein
MRAAALIAGALALGGTGGVLLGGCGGGTRTVTISAAPTTATETGVAGHSTSTATASTPTSSTTTTTGAPAGIPTTAGGTPGQEPSTTRTAPEPAFTHTGTQSEEAAPSAQAAAAAAVVRAHGYTLNNTSDYHPNQTLTVLVGTRTGSADGHDQLAFFFLDGRYIGTDSSQPSASVRVVSQSDTEVTLAYALYRPHDSLCCPSGGQATVHFQLNDGTLTPLDPIPPASSSTGLARQ